MDDVKSAAQCAVRGPGTAGVAGRAAVAAVPELPALKRQVRRDLLVAAGLLAGLAGLAAAWAGLPWWFVAQAVGAFALAGAMVWRGLPWHPHRRFGAANRVTLGRLAVVALFAALALQPALQDLPDPDGVAWAVVVMATVCAVVDAADGPLARASGLASAFGARFDMETDALFILVLCVLIVRLDKAGAWVLAAGVMRYAFVAAAALPRAQWLAGPLPPSLRRKTVCVAQIVALIVCLGPVIPYAWSSAVAAAGLAALAGSFAADVAWLARARRRPA
jgi:phosphatidylglycerophosphate synthase